MLPAREKLSLLSKRRVFPKDKLPNLGKKLQENLLAFRNRVDPQKLWTIINKIGDNLRQEALLIKRKVPKLSLNYKSYPNLLKLRLKERLPKLTQIKLPEFRRKISPPLGKTYTISQAAQILGISPSTLRRWEREGKFKSHRTPGGQRRFTLKEINHLLHPPRFSLLPLFRKQSLLLLKNIPTIVLLISVLTVGGAFAKEAVPRLTKIWTDNTTQGLNLIGKALPQVETLTQKLTGKEMPSDEEELITYLGAVLGENKIPSLLQLKLTTTTEPPLIVASSQMVSNLNAEMVGGVKIEEIALASDLEEITVDVADLTLGTFRGTTDYTFPGNLKIKGGQIHLTPIETGVATEGTIYYDADADKLYLRTASAWVDLTQQDSDTTYSADDGIDISSTNKISVDVSELYGTGLSEDSSNNLILDTSYADDRYLTEDTADTMNANLTMGSSATLYFAGGTTYYINTSGTGNLNDLTVAGGDLTVGSSAVLSDSAGTLTLSNVDALDATTESTIETAIDTLANLTSASSLATIGTITTGVWQGTAIDAAYLDANAVMDDTAETISARWTFQHANNQGLNLPTNAGAPSAVTGTAEGDIVWDTTNDTLYVYDSSAFTAIKSLFTDGGTTTYLTSTTDDLALGGTDSSAPFFMDVSTGNLTLTGDITISGGDLTVGSSAALSDSAGTLTLSNVDALDATTETTIESAIDTLANLTSASSLATVGTITTGTWQGTAVADAYVADDITASNYLPLAGGTMTGTMSFNDTNTQIYEDGSSNLTLKDANAGTYTLQQITKNLDVVTSDITVQNTTTETSIYSYTVPGGTLGTANLLRLIILYSYENNTGVNTQNVTFRLKYGATTLITYQTGNTVAGAGYNQSRVIIYLKGDGATNAQWASLSPDFSQYPYDPEGFHYRSSGLAGTSAEDSTTNLTLEVTVQHNAASTNLTFIRRAATLELMYDPPAGADVAEWYPSSDSSIEAGDVVSTDPEQITHIKKSEKAYDSSVVGIIATEPATVLGEYEENSQRVALIGRVPVKIWPGSEPIVPGDFLTSSPEPGKAMKATQAGPTIGKALEEWQPNSGKEQIVVFVNIGTSLGALDPISGSFLTNTSLSVQDLYLSSDEFEEEENPAVETDGQPISLASELEPDQEVSTTPQAIDSLFSEQTSTPATSSLKEILLSILSRLSKLETKLTRFMTSLAEEITTKLIRLEKLEMVDRTTGEIYCVTIENGEFKKVKGECGGENTPAENTSEVGQDQPQNTSEVNLEPQVNGEATTSAEPTETPTPSPTPLPTETPSEAPSPEPSPLNQPPQNSPSPPEPE